MLIARLLAVSFLAWSSLAAAQHAHDHKPKHGGVVREANGFVFELKVASNEIIVWVTDEANKPVSTTGAKGQLTLIPDASLRAQVPLEPAGDNRLRAAGNFTIKPGSTAMLDVAMGGKSIAKLRYVLK
ncbi:MAG TPA: hypothetical protein VNE58_05950 [Casimicrobiaceae bacterium]|nr:hypothetical protein [Casimicrobiaceae bacterium]